MWPRKHQARRARLCNSRSRQVREFLYREARYLDDKDWDNWLDLYASDAEFWMPAWDDDDKLTQDPQNESLADLVRRQERA